MGMASEHYWLEVFVGWARIVGVGGIFKLLGMGIDWLAACMAARPLAITKEAAVILPLVAEAGASVMQEAAEEYDFAISAQDAIKDS